MIFYDAVFDWICKKVSINADSSFFILFLSTNMQRIKKNKYRHPVAEIEEGRVGLTPAVFWLAGVGGGYDCVS
ncbi:MAG: hypothetical protein XXXJIFNMEKO3_01625 [Candidatus Erwinia impunctatus]|nr:hypothetical protein XXXJIFNMEKO_01625 [Culicoides impunctatus]